MHSRWFQPEMFCLAKVQTFNSVAPRKYLNTILESGDPNDKIDDDESPDRYH